jgi:hypothetical protein
LITAGKSIDIPLDTDIAIFLVGYIIADTNRTRYNFGSSSIFIFDEGKPISVVSYKYIILRNKNYQG